MTEIPMTPPRCAKCGRFVRTDQIGTVLDVLTFEHLGLDVCHDFVNCPRCGRQEVSWW